MERDLTKGSIGGNIFRFALPYFLSYFLQTLYGMADLFIIGQFDSVAGTTAVSIGSQVMHMNGYDRQICWCKAKEGNLKDHWKYDHFIFRNFSYFNSDFIVSGKSYRPCYVNT